MDNRYGDGKSKIQEVGPTAAPALCPGIMSQEECRDLRSKQSRVSHRTEKAARNRGRSTAGRGELHRGAPTSAWGGRGAL